MAIGKAIFQEVDRCGRCWRLFPISQLQKQDGHLRCVISCTDDLSTTTEKRQRLISDVLSSGQEGVSDKPELFSDPGELSFE
jgi:hypothetical protein